MNRLTNGLIAACVCLVACGSDSDTNTQITGTVTGGAGDASMAQADAGSAPLDASSGEIEASTVTNPNPNCQSGNDVDGDHFTVQEGDCNDCDPAVNPGAYDFPGNEYDEDCSGQPAEVAEAECDQGLNIASTAAEDAARAIGLCKFTKADKRDWGVIEARFTTADGTGTLDSPLQVGLVPGFGKVVPRAGASLLALSSGMARAPEQGATSTISNTFNGSGHAPPTGFPKASSVCPRTIFDAASKTVFNQAALEVKIRVPTNAYSLSFDSIFYSYEYPDYICQPYNDFFITLLEPHDKGDGNIVFDSNGDPIGVNTGLLAVCDPSQQLPDSPKQFECKQGTNLLSGTGFGKDEYMVPGLFGSTKGTGGAATGWLTTVAPAAAGTVITLRFAIWDTGDAKMDSTVLIDRFVWSVAKPTAPTTMATPVLL